MLVNFAIDRLGTTVSCDKVSSDDHEPANLLQCRGSWHQRGFLAERFIKPPVTLTLKFACPVNLSHIVLDPQVGSQRSSVIEIYTAVQQRYNTSQMLKVSERRSFTSDDSEKLRGSSVSYNGDRSVSEPIFKKIGCIRCFEPGIVCFSNQNFLSDHSVKLNCSKLGHTHYADLRHHQQIMLSSVDLLSVRILATVNGSVVAVGKLEVWGQPARSCSSLIKEDVFRKYRAAVGLQEDNRSGDVEKSGAKNRQTGNSWHLLNNSAAELEKSSHQSNDKMLNSSMKGQTLDHKSSKKVEIPEDFLDELTFDIMTTPLLLPSGRCIDVSTLDKFADSEANYGRQPSDPFTGLVFTSARHPVLNKSLKMRIDRFLSEHADEPSLQKVPRALGCAAQVVHTIADSNKTKDIHSKSLHHKIEIQKKNLKRVKDKELLNEAQTDLQMPRQSFASDSKTSDNKMPKVEVSAGTLPQGIDSNFPPQSSTCIQPDINSSRSLEASHADKSHEELLKSSLNSTLFSVLRDLPSFTSSSAQSPEFSQSPAETSRQCSTCKTKINSAANGVEARINIVTYKLPCEHVMCQACLSKTLSSKETACHVCNRQFTKADIVRVHFH